jgi:hypothetical protein
MYDRGARDIVKAAETLSDIELVLSETDLTGITVIDREIPFITSSGTPHLLHHITPPGYFIQILISSLNK